MGPVTYIAAGASLGLLIMTGLYLDKRDDYAQAVSDCNASKLAEVAEAERAVRETLEAAYERQKAEWIALYEAKDSALKEAEVSRDAALVGRDDREARIQKLTLEASVDEIPDSFECLNVFIPWAALDWMRNADENCPETGDSTGAGSDQVCTNPGGLNGTLPSPGDFSTITYSDGMLIWGRERDNLEIANGRLLAIRHLSDTLVEQPVD